MTIPISIITPWFFIMAVSLWLGYVSHAPWRYPLGVGVKAWMWWSAAWFVTIASLFLAAQKGWIIWS